MMSEKIIKSRFSLTHDTYDNWFAIGNDFIPVAGEIIVYDADAENVSPRFKIGDGVRTINDLEFLLDTQYILHNSNTLSQLLEQYIFNIDYDATLAFDTSEIVIGQSTTSILGQAILGQLILA